MEPENNKREAQEQNEVVEQNTIVDVGDVVVAIVKEAILSANSNSGSGSLSRHSSMNLLKKVGSNTSLLNLPDDQKILLQKLNALNEELERDPKGFLSKEVGKGNPPEDGGDNNRNNSHSNNENDSNNNDCNNTSSSISDSNNNSNYDNAGPPPLEAPEHWNSNDQEGRPSLETMQHYSSSLDKEPTFFQRFVNRRGWKSGGSFFSSSTSSSDIMVHSVSPSPANTNNNNNTISSSIHSNDSSTADASLKNTPLASPDSNHVELEAETSYSIKQKWWAELDMKNEFSDNEIWSTLATNDEETFRKSVKAIADHVRKKGIPGYLRGHVWYQLSACDNELVKNYNEYLKQETPFDAIISRDIARTFPTHQFFQEKHGGQESLFNVLKAYAAYDPQVGYCQGLAFICGLLLLHMPEEEAFGVLIALLNDYQLRSMYQPGMDGVYIRVYQLEHLIKEYFPKLAKQFEKNGLNVIMFASSWFLTAFATDVPMNPAVRILDVIFVDGIEALFRFALLFLKKCYDELMIMNFEEMMSLLKGDIYSKHFTSVDTFVLESLQFKISARKLQKLEKEGLALIEQKQISENAMEIIIQEKTQLEMEVKAQCVEIVHLQSEKDIMQQKLTLLQSENEKFQDAIHELQLQVQALKKSFPEKESNTFDALVKEIQSQKETIQNWEKQYADMASELAIAKVSYAESETEREKYINEYEKISKLYQERAEEKSRLETQLLEIKVLYAQSETDRENEVEKLSKLYQEVLEEKSNFEAQLLDTRLKYAACEMEKASLEEVLNKQMNT